VLEPERSMARDKTSGRHVGTCRPHRYSYFFFFAAFFFAAFFLAGIVYIPPFGLSM